MSSTQKFKYQGTVLKVAIPSPLRSLFDYLPDESSVESSIKPGMRVKVNFGKRKLVGVVVRLEKGSTLSRNKLKPVTAVLDSEAVFTPSVFRLLLWATSYYQHASGEVFSNALPARLRQGRQIRESEEVWQVCSSANEVDLLSVQRAPRQQALLTFLKKNPVKSREECKAAGFTANLFAELEKKNLVRRSTRITAGAGPFTAPGPDSSTNIKNIKLNNEQQKALSEIEKNLDHFACSLLDGVTGSGKTEVYMRAMQTQLSKGKQCMVLVPEIGLTPQTVSRFRQRFECPVVVLHSGLNETERLTAWNNAREGSAGIIIGTRSAIFTPMAKPGLIIVDEEHDSSFKQQDGFRYSARDLAVMRAREEKIQVILGSATPSLESLHNARTKKFLHLKLSTRAADAKPAAMEVMDISEQHLEEGFSEALLFRIQKHLANNGQVLVFINRRGFAPVLNCNNCGWICECEHCLSRYTVHASPPSIRCHHCGSAKSLPRHCQHCKSSDLNTIGIGTQRIESFLKSRFAKTKVLRIDRDSTRGKDSLQKMLDQVHGGEPCILLGTQMLAKGHHFPDITLVAIIDADSGLFSADFRGQEQMAQTIVQVAGRSGRASRAGEVVIQSRHGGHQTLQSISTAPYEEFATRQLEERRNSTMPPFSHLCLIRAESAEIKGAISSLKKIVQAGITLVSTQGYPVELQGPIPAPMEKRAGRFRTQLLLKSRNRRALQAFMTELCRKIDQMRLPQKVRLSIDVDPQDMI
jgi:primosomal protein N' (replication factor Y) (superfamily II helicase)